MLNVYLHSKGVKYMKQEIPEKLLNAIPEEDSFDDYISVCEVTIKVTSKLLKLKKWVLNTAIPYVDNLFDYEPSTEAEETIEIMQENQTPANTENDILEETLENAYNILHKQLNEYSKYGLLIFRAADAQFDAKEILGSWARKSLPPPRLEKLHNNAIAKIAKLPPSVINSLPYLDLEYTPSLDKIFPFIETATIVLTEILDKYKVLTQCDNVTQEDLDKQDYLKKLVKRLYAGGILNLNEIDQIPAHKVKLFEIGTCTDYETVTQVQDFILDHRIEIENILGPQPSAL